ncbi:unnamed protein product [Prunus armeniaca]
MGCLCSFKSQRREKCEYNHRLYRKGYVGLEDELEETMPGEEIDRSLLWKKEIEDKQGNIPDPKVVEKEKSIQRVKFADKLKESVMEVGREETKKMEARAKESVMEAVKVEREILLKQFSQLIPNFDPNLLGKIPTTLITPIPQVPQDQSPKNPMSDKASCSNVRALELDEDNPMNDADAPENRQDGTTSIFILQPIVCANLTA